MHLMLDDIWFCSTGSNVFNLCRMTLMLLILLLMSCLLLDTVNDFALSDFFARHNMPLLLNVLFFCFTAFSFKNYGGRC